MEGTVLRNWFGGKWVMEPRRTPQTNNIQMDFTSLSADVCISDVSGEQKNSLTIQPRSWKTKMNNII